MPEERHTLGERCGGAEHLLIPPALQREAVCPRLFPQRLPRLVAHGPPLQGSWWRFIYPGGRGSAGLLLNVVEQAVYRGLIGQRLQRRNLRWRAAKAGPCQEMARLVEIHSQSDAR